MIFKSKPGFALILLFLSVVCVAGRQAEAQEAKPTLPAHFADHVAAKYHQQSLKQIVTALDKQAGLNILIDGEPLTPIADIDVDGTLEEALNKIANIFDYNWKVGKGGIVLFNKRFRNRNDFPQANVTELVHLVKNMSDIFALTKADSDISVWKTELKLLSASFTEQQKTAFLDGKHISAKDLSPGQFAHLRTAVLNNIFSYPLKVWTDLVDHLNFLDSAYLIANPAPEDPAHPGVPRYGYQIFWHDRDGSLSSENINTEFFGND